MELTTDFILLLHEYKQNVSVKLVASHSHINTFFAKKEKQCTHIGISLNHFINKMLHLLT